MRQLLRAVFTLIGSRLAPGNAPRVLGVLLMLAGCALPAAQRPAENAGPQRGALANAHGGIAAWHLNELARLGQTVVLLRSPQGIHGTVETALLQNILATGEKILQATGDGPTPDFVVTGSGTVNAYAYLNGANPTIAFSLGMLRLLAEDQDAWAALFGHELAHLRLEHLRGMKQRRERAAITSSLAGAILSAIGVPFASLATDATAALADRAYSRDDEREADRIGLDYMRRAGFAAAGAITLQQRLLTIPGSTSIPFLSTHPGGEERIENLRQLIHGDH